MLLSPEAHFSNYEVLYKMISFVLVVLIHTNEKISFHESLIFFFFFDGSDCRTDFGSD